MSPAEIRLLLMRMERWIFNSNHLDPNYPLIPPLILLWGSEAMFAIWNEGLAKSSYHAEKHTAGSEA